MSDTKTVCRMRDAIVYTIVKNIPEIEPEMRRATAQIHEGRVYIWIELDDAKRIFTHMKANRFACYWQSICKHFNHQTQLFIQTNN